MNERGEAETVYLSATKVRHRYDDLSEMGLWRWLKDEALGFPPPLVINRRRFWSIADLEEWERRQAAKSRRVA